MNFKVTKILKDNKRTLIVMGVLWLILAIILISPIAYSIVEATNNGSFHMDTFFEKVISSITSFNTVGLIFQSAYIGMFFKTLLYFTIVYIVFVVIGLFRSKPKHEYSDIEHGSSDWSENGEQYQVLSKNKGIILAEDNYLPLDKRGNINVLVVGRFWFW